MKTTEHMLSEIGNEVVFVDMRLRARLQGRAN